MARPVERFVMNVGAEPGESHRHVGGIGRHAPFGPIEDGVIVVRPGQRRTPTAGHAFVARFGRIAEGRFLGIVATLLVLGGQ